jgi:hypothetical protein
MIMWFCLWFCFCAEFNLLICIYWTILASMEWNQLDRGVWSF